MSEVVRVLADQALVASLPEPVPVSAHSGDGPSREPDMSWFLIAVSDRFRSVVILDYADGWKEHAIGFHWEDTFETDPPDHLAPGAYRWTDFTIGFWDEDDAIAVKGGRFTRDSDGSGEAGETRSGSTEGDSAGLQGIAQPDPQRVGSETATDVAKREGEA